MKNSFYFYTTFTLLIVLGLVIAGYIFGWTTPSTTPPGGNLAASINTGSTAQTKTGTLAVGGIKIGSSGTNFTELLHGTVSVDPPSISAGASATLSVTITGAATGNRIFLTPPSSIYADLFYQGTDILSANTATIRIGNEGAAAVDDSARTWAYLIIKP